MRNPSRDPDLEGLFQELRDEDRRRAPSFQDLMAGARQRAAGRARDIPAHRPTGRWSRRRLAWAGSLLAAAAAAALLFLPGRGTSDAEFELAVRSFSTNPAGGAWRSPTDALLVLPGSDVLTTLPKVGGRRWPADSGTRTRSNQL